MPDTDFGTYHHSTPEESKQIRDEAAKAFSKLLRSICPSNAGLRILDAGCGLGFLTYVAAKCFPKASVMGVDLKYFEERSTLINELHRGGSERWPYQIKALRKR